LVVEIIFVVQAINYSLSKRYYINYIWEFSCSSVDLSVWVTQN